MIKQYQAWRALQSSVTPLFTLTIAAFVTACASTSAAPATAPAPTPGVSAASGPPSPDPRVGLKAGLNNAEEAAWNLRKLATAAPTGRFVGSTNSDLAFIGNYVIQGNYNGYQVWDITNPSAPTLKTSYFCPASQSDVSVYKNLLFVSGEGLGGRLDCGGQGVQDTVSTERLRGLRIFDITDINNPKNVGNVQTCRGSHTHSVLVDPKDPANVYVYISGSAPIRSNKELPGCVGGLPSQDPNSALFRIEVIKVPLANPGAAAVVSSPRIFADLVEAKSHGETAVDIAAGKKAEEQARAKGQFTANVFGSVFVLPDEFVKPQLDSIVKARGGSGAATAADSAALRAAIPGIVQKMIGEPLKNPDGTVAGPTQCHDITVYPEIGRAGGACEGYGFLLDITNPANPVRLTAVADTNFSYWHSATFNNDGTKLLFSDEWGGGGAPKCRATDPKEWGADALFTINGDKLDFQSYYKMPAPQTANENCVAHNGSLIPIPGRDVMVQSWYQGGISIFDWTDTKNPKEIAFFDRGPADSTRMASGGSWSVYWYNGSIVSSEISRGLDVFELLPSAYISQNEIDAAKSVKFDYLNVQGQQKFVWPATFALARAYLDQLERSGGLSASAIASTRAALTAAEQASGAARTTALTTLAAQVEKDAKGADAAKIQKLAATMRDLAK